MERPSLFSPDNETAIIGGLLVYPQYLPTLRLLPDDFADATCRQVYGIMQALDSKQMKIGYTVVLEALERQGALHESGAWLIGAMSGFVGGIDAIESAARIIGDYAMRRRAVAQAEKLATAAMNLKANFAEAQASIVDELAGNVQTRGAVSISEWMVAEADRIEAAYNEKPEGGLLTGLADLDKIFEGLLPGTLMLTGEAGKGKTILAENIAAHFATQAPGIFYSFELTEEQLTKRMLAAETGLSPKALRRGEISEGDYIRALEACGLIGNRRMFVTDRPMSIAELRADFTRMKYEHDIKWFWLDHIGFITDEPYGLKSHEIPAYLVRKLTGICKTLGILGCIINTETKSGEYSGASSTLFDVSYYMRLSDHLVKEGEEPLPNVYTIHVRKERHAENNDRFADVLKLPSRPKFVNLKKETVKLP